ncbi:TolC family protein [Cloacibacillus sp.]
MRKILVFVLMCLLLPSVAAADEGQTVTIRQTIQRALESYPEVQGKLHAYGASRHDLEGSYSGYRPKLDVYAGIGRYNLDGDGYRYTAGDMYNHDYDGLSAVATQPIYDGNLTNSSVKRYKYAKNMRYFDLLSTMEQVSYAAFRSHQDVVRYRELVALAKGNLARHEEVLKKVQKRTKAGVDSSVNYDTAYGRVALARVNLITEESNLHDAETQYARIVGEAPAANLEDHAIDVTLPALPQEGRKAALAGNYQLISYAENAESMRHVVGEQTSRMRPKVDVRAGTYLNNDEDGTQGCKDKAFVELVLHWNLYNGGLDKENIKKAIEQYKESEELYGKLERDVVQSVLIAYNDIKNTEKQIPNLATHVETADVTRTAYTKQFEAGRRSLFDLLDSENEYFQASMSYANAKYNIKNMKAEYLATTGTLLSHYSIEVPAVPTLTEAKIDMDKIVEELSKRQNDESK